MIVVHRGEFVCKPPPGANWDEFFQSRKSEEYSMAVERIVWAFQEVNRGFHVREMLGEGYGPFEIKWALSGGNWKLRSDYSDHYSRSAEPFPAEHEHPYLVGATKQEVTVNSALWAVFQASTPVLGFSPLQQRVFLQALRGYSNESTAARLRISEESVHNCFRMGYDKVREHPVLSGEIENEGETEPGKARSRKREKFIDILRRHPEELRPWSTKPALKRTGAPAFSASAE
jgi:DNA-binding CsgD family transcriptional regulator